LMAPLYSDKYQIAYLQFIRQSKKINLKNWANKQFL
jgi:hypothetical protein